MNYCQETNRLLSCFGHAVMSTLTDDGTEVGTLSRSSLIGPLICKLPISLQARILKSASETLEKGKWWLASANGKK